MKKHEILEKNVGLLTLFMILAVSIGGPTPRCSWKDATSTSVKAASAVTRR